MANKRAKIILEICILLLTLDTWVKALNESLFEEYLLLIKMYYIVATITWMNWTETTSTYEQHSENLC